MAERSPSWSWYLVQLWRVYAARRPVLGAVLLVAFLWVALGGVPLLLISDDPLSLLIGLLAGGLLGGPMFYMAIRQNADAWQSGAGSVGPPAGWPTSATARNYGLVSLAVGAVTIAGALFLNLPVVYLLAAQLPVLVLLWVLQRRHHQSLSVPR